VVTSSCVSSARLAVHAVGEVADQVRHGRLQRAGVGAQPAAAHIVHPGAAALAGARRGVQVELAHQLQPCGQRARCGKTARWGATPGALSRRDVHVEQGLDDLEQARQHLGCGEVLLDLLLAEGVARFLELFAA